LEERDDYYPNEMDRLEGKSNIFWQLTLFLILYLSISGNSGICNKITPKEELRYIALEIKIWAIETKY